MSEYIMNRELLKRHCEAMCHKFKDIPTSGTYGEHRLVLELLEQTEWIPCSERLPEEAFGCLVTILDTDLRTQDEFENILPYMVGYDGGTWNNADGEPIPFEVVAWMPLPEPYEPQESEDV